MTKGKGEGGPYREQGPGVPRETTSEPFERDFADLLGEEMRGTPSHCRPAVRPLSTARNTCVSFSLAGKAGEVLTISKPSQMLFKGEEFFAQDNSSRPGHGTRIVEAFVGNVSQFYGSSDPGELGIPTWMFYEWTPPEERKLLETAASLVGTKHESAKARAAWASLRLMNAAKKTWTTIQPGLPWSWRIRFEKTCRWDGVLWGKELR